MQGFTAVTRLGTVAKACQTQMDNVQSSPLITNSIVPLDLFAACTVHKCDSLFCIGKSGTHTAGAMTQTTPAQCWLQQ